MTVNRRLAEQLKATVRNSEPRRATTVFAIFGTLAGLLVGWFAHDRYWRTDSMDYALDRVVTLSARCKNISTSEQRRRVEDRVSKPFSQFGIDDKLVAIDYILDRLEIGDCLK